MAGTLTISHDATTTTASSSATSTGFGQSVTLSATVTANAPGSGTPTGSVDFFDTTTGDDLGSVALSGGKASLSTASLPVGANTIKVTYSGDGNFLASSASTGTITINQSIIVLDPTAGGALTLSGNASIKLTGGVFVDSSSSTRPVGQRQRRDQSVGDRRARRRPEERQRELQPRARPPGPRCWPTRSPRCRSRARPA